MWWGKTWVRASPCLGGLPGVGWGQPAARQTGEPQGRPGTVILYSWFLVLPFFFLSLFIFHLIFSSFSFPCGIPVHRPEIRSEPLRLEPYVCTAGVTENPRTQEIVTATYPRGPRLHAKTRLYPTACNLHGWKPQVKQLVRQEHSPTHQKNK